MQNYSMKNHQYTPSASFGMKRNLCVFGSIYKCDQQQAKRDQNQAEVQ